jgi:hypothetical protein
VRAAAFLCLLTAFATGFSVPKQTNQDHLRTGLLEKNTLFTVYGRGFGKAAILGRLGAYKNIEDMANGTRRWVKQIRP